MQTRLSTLLLTLAVAATSYAQAQSLPDSARATLDKDIPPLLAQYAIPGVSIAAISAGRLALVAAYGMQSEGVPATAESLYNIASLTKPLTAEVVLRLASQDKLSLDEAMYHFWTDPDVVGDDRHKLLTPRLALDHQTGFPNWRDRQQGLRFTQDPGTRFGYSGEGYQYVARFIEKKTGHSLDTPAGSYLFQPAGMHATAYTGQAWFAGRIARPHDAAGKPMEPTIATRANAADLVYSTPSDYAAFMLDVLDDKGLSAGVASERGRIQTDTRATICSGTKAAACPAAAGTGLGWEILQFNSAAIMMHTGKDDGLFTFAYLDKASRSGAVIMTNGDNGYKIVIPVLERLHINPEFLRFLQNQ